MKGKTKNKKIKFISPNMEFNPALGKYEPKLPIKKGKLKINFQLKYLLWLILIVITLFIIEYIYYKLGWKF